VRLKDKLGSRAMAAGETIMEGAVAYLMGEPGRGLKHMMDQVNLSRLSHGFRAAGMMRRCLNEALQVARHRRTFGRTLIDHPMARRQLLKLMLPTEQALTVGVAAAVAMTRGEEAQLRILTPMLKYRSCRDNVTVATGAMEMRGGNGYIEDWGNAKLVRDAHLGLLWEGTSSVNALDIVRRAVGREQAHAALAAALHKDIADAPVPGQFRGRVAQLIDRATAFAETVARQADAEASCRRAASGLYHAASAALMAAEGARLGAQGGDARRLLLARLVIDHRLGNADPFSLPDHRWEDAATARLLDDKIVTMDDAVQLLGG
jgi:hypothetical protein